jgi:transcription initiation factor TFIIIB Brf1 subunit/transcription initiation factor TFIIB
MDFSEFLDDFTPEEEAFFSKVQQSVKNKEDKEDDLMPECVHETQITEDGNEVCIHCGLETSMLIDNAPEWRFYKENDTKQSFDPSRCFLRKYEEKSIYRDVEQYNIPKEVLEIANNNYVFITEDSILRGNSRKGLIVACIFYAYEDLGQRKSQDEIKNFFSINKKILSNGMKMFNLKIKRSPIYSSPLDFIPKIMSKFSLSDKHIQFVTKLYTKICSKSAFINRSNPDSIAAGLSYFVLKHINFPVSLTEFSKRVGLSDITIHKISKKIKDIVEQSL